jgi:hypothetical protein
MSHVKMKSYATSGSTSLHLFRSFLVVLPDGTFDASKIHSQECYLQWLANREVHTSDPEMKKFQRALSNHLSGVDGRSPFSVEEERAILQVLREKRKWPCCASGHITIGVTGFRSHGYHEKRLKTGEDITPFKKLKLEGNKPKLMIFHKTDSSSSLETDKYHTDSSYSLETDYSKYESLRDKPECVFSGISDSARRFSFELPGLINLLPPSEEELIKGWLPESMCSFV